MCGYSVKLVVSFHNGPCSIFVVAAAASLQSLFILATVMSVCPVERRGVLDAGR